MKLREHDDLDLSVRKEERRDLFLDENGEHFANLLSLIITYTCSLLCSVTLVLSSITLSIAHS